MKYGLAVLVSFLVESMRYQHTQRAPLHWLLWAIAAVEVGAAWAVREQPAISFILLAGALLFAVLAAGFMHLKVEDEGDFLAVRFGPLPLFRKLVRYDDITRAETGRSAPIDGWGIHYVPGRGWTYNLWGYDCVELQLGEKRVRIGTDDAANLAEFLRRKVHTS